MKVEIINKLKDRNVMERGLEIRATHNGFQWSTIGVGSDSELRQIRDEINKYLGCPNYTERR